MKPGPAMSIALDPAPERLGLLQRLDERLRQLARVLLQGFGQLHGGGAGKVAVRGHLGGLESRLVAGTGQQALQRGRKAGQQFLFDSEHGAILRAPDERSPHRPGNRADRSPQGFAQGDEAGRAVLA